MVEMCTFGSVKSFCSYWNHMPKPSAIFGAQKNGTKRIEAICCFKEGVKPMWEDAANVKGGEWQCKRGIDFRDLDELWGNLVMGMVGETIDQGDEITGARLVDKSRGRNAVYRLEVWYRDVEKQVEAEAIRVNLEKTLIIGGQYAEAHSFGFEAVSHVDKRW